MLRENLDASDRFNHHKKWLATTGFELHGVSQKGRTRTANVLVRARFRQRELMSKQVRRGINRSAAAEAALFTRCERTTNASKIRRPTLLP